MGDLFDEGGSNEKPVHRVCLDGYFLGKHEVTQEQWLFVMKTDPAAFGSSRSRPVEQTSWVEVRQFIRKLNGISGKRYRLPTEAEWEFACRERGKKVRFGNGRNLATVDEINFDPHHSYPFSEKSGLYRGETVPVGSFRPNALGLYDMSGNVYELVADMYRYNAYEKHALRNPLFEDAARKEQVLHSDRAKSTDDTAFDLKKYLAPTLYYAIRGGSWDRYAERSRCTTRSRIHYGQRHFGVGFRLASSAEVP